MIKNIVLDMGNVLLDYNPEVCLKQYVENEEERAIIRKELFGGPEWIQGDLGYLKEEEKYEGVSRRVPAQLHEKLKKCADGWDACMIPVEGAREFCKYAREKGYKLYVLSNASNSFYQYFTRFAPLEDFDGILVSSDIHLIKPDIQIYQYFLEKFQLIAEETFFIDDRKENIEGAKQAGMRGMQFCGDFGKIRKYLEEM